MPPHNKASARKSPASQKVLRLGVDTGGTFTDCVVFEGGKVKILKVFSTPADPSEAIVEGVFKLADGHPGFSALEVIHGTTVGTNSLLERRGARVALVTTGGFEDLLEIGRQARPDLYDLTVQQQPPLVPRPLRIGVIERIAPRGEVVRSLSKHEIRRVVVQVRKSKADSIAICFLFSFANPEHERRIASALSSLGIPISISSQILPEYREFERISTTVINAYLAPRMSEYLRNLQSRVRETLSRKSARPPAESRVFVMQSNGGICTAELAAQQPVRTILSGPAGGVVASTWLAEQIGVARAMSFDMGGTSTDVCLLDGQPRTTNETQLAGLPVAVPVLDVHSVGAGGGSLARIDAGGALRVGPESAGASPGPICYGRGGLGLTVTDANLILGRLDPEHFLGGAFALDVSAAGRGFENFLAGPGRRAGFTSAVELANGIVAVSNATMEKALRVISVERGHDPREFSLICYGGAGGLHAADLARSLGMRSVIVPQNPGAFSALGILLSDVVRDASKSVLMPVPSEGAAKGSELFLELSRGFERIERATLTELTREGFDLRRARLIRSVAVRYQGQSYELTVPFSSAFDKSFYREHLKTYGYAHAGRPVEIVSMRVQIVIPNPKPVLRLPKVTGPGTTKQALIKTKPVWFGGKPHRTVIYNRERLNPGASLTGPAVIVEYSSTTVVPPDFACRVDEHGNLILRERKGGNRAR
jgi:N-methylhydantoinase A